MKTFYRHLLFWPFMLAMVFQVHAQVTASPGHNTNVRSAFSLPFSEDWESHSFSTNQWTLSDNAWVIDVYNGNDGAAAKFKGSAMLSNYSSTLTSNWMAGSQIFVGRVTFKFDLKLQSIVNSGSEYLYIKVFDGTNYITLDSINNTGNIDWETHSYVISSYIYGNDFKIVFEAKGFDSSRILGWFIDNIEIYRECDPPEKLDAMAIWDKKDDMYSDIFWLAPASITPPSNPWTHWDSGTNFSAISLTNGGNLSVAARWDANSLSDFDGDTIKKIKVYISDDQFDYLVLHIWTGADAANNIYTDTVNNPVAGTWNEYTVTDTLLFDASLEYWFGYELVNTAAEAYCAGTDAGPAVVGYGDKISTDGGNSWDNISDFGLSYNWNIQMLLQEPPPNDSSLEKFVVYKSTDYDNYFPLDTVYFTSGKYSYTYKDYGVVWRNMYYYKVNAIWSDNIDTCVSEFARSLLMPMNDFVRVWFIDQINEQPDSKLITYPNPVNNQLTVNAEADIVQITLVDLSGKTVLNKAIPKQRKATLNVTGLPAGLYAVKVVTEKGAYSKKVMKK